MPSLALSTIQDTTATSVLISGIEVLAGESSDLYLVKYAIAGKQHETSRTFADFEALHAELSTIDPRLTPRFPIDQPDAGHQLLSMSGEGPPSPAELGELRKTFQQKMEALTLTQLTEYLVSLVPAAPASPPAALGRFLALPPAVAAQMELRLPMIAQAVSTPHADTAAAGGYVFTLPSKRELAQVESAAPSQRVLAAKAAAAGKGVAGASAAVENPSAQDANSSQGIGVAKADEQVAMQSATTQPTLAQPATGENAAVAPPLVVSTSCGAGSGAAEMRVMEGGGLADAYDGVRAGNDSDENERGSASGSMGKVCALVGAAGRAASDVADYVRDGCCFGSFGRAASHYWQRLADADEEDARARHAPSYRATTGDQGKPLKQGRFAAVAAGRRGGGSRQNRAIVLMVICSVSVVCVGVACWLNTPGIFLGDPGDRLGDRNWLWQVIPGADVVLPGVAAYRPRDANGRMVEEAVVGIDACRAVCMQDRHCHGLAFSGEGTACDFKGGEDMEPQTLWRRRRSASGVELHILWGRHNEPPSPPPPLPPPPLPPPSPSPPYTSPVLVLPA